MPTVVGRSAAAQRPTINIPSWFFPIFGAILLFLNKNEKQKSA
jgi:hypothetical protein